LFRFHSRKCLAVKRCKLYCCQPSQSFLHLNQCRQFILVCLYDGKFRRESVSLVRQDFQIARDTASITTTAILFPTWILPTTALHTYFRNSSAIQLTLEIAIVLRRLCTPRFEP